MKVPLFELSKSRSSERSFISRLLNQRSPPLPRFRGLTTRGKQLKAEKANARSTTPTESSPSSSAPPSPMTVPVDDALSALTLPVDSLSLDRPVELCQSPSAMNTEEPIPRRSLLAPIRTSALGEKASGEVEMCTSPTEWVESPRSAITLTAGGDQAVGRTWFASPTEEEPSSYFSASPQPFAPRS